MKRRVQERTNSQIRRRNLQQCLAKASIDSHELKPDRRRVRFRAPCRRICGFETLSQSRHGQEIFSAADQFLRSTSHGWRRLLGRPRGFHAVGRGSSEPPGKDSFEPYFSIPKSGSEYLTLVWPELSDAHQSSSRIRGGDGESTPIASVSPGACTCATRALSICFNRRDAQLSWTAIPIEVKLMPSSDISSPRRRRFTA